jgi:hypothetical protein
MSFVHYTIIGHFDPETLFPDRPLKPTRSLEAVTVARLLSECPPEVREQVEFSDGFVIVHWARCHVKWVEAVRQFGYRLAEQENCVSAESPFYFITYPPWAEQAQRRAADALSAAQ